MKIAFIGQDVPTLLPALLTDLLFANGEANAELAVEEGNPAMRELLREYNASERKSFDDLLDFHYRFECIHPFQDGNGRVGRLILFKECLRSGIVPFIITDQWKMYYYRGLQNWETERGYLRDTCLTAQDSFKKILDYFQISYRSDEQA